MARTSSPRRRNCAGLASTSATLLANALLLVAGAQAQSPSCELLKQSLSARIPPAITGYAMDDVPAKTPVPAGGKVIGTCEGGARKVVYRRFGGPPLGGDESPSGAPAAAASGPREATAAPPTKPAKMQAAQPIVREPAAPPAVTPVTTIRAGAVTGPPPPALPMQDPPAAPSVAAPPVPVPQAPVSQPVALDDEPGLLARHGHWLWLLLAIPLLVWLWAWVSHRMAYDSAGLPRGPRL